MLNALKKLFSSAPQTAFDKLHKNGAQIIDVRTPGEFQQGHIKGSVNIPLQVLPNQTSKIKKGKPIILCCASGMRSASAKSILVSKGFTEVYDGGGWTSLQNKIN
ncbi:MAG: rhodanese-like domain-containing protein [Saprospiraceae bacterium]|jgi:rhodanese-related sulfurtransferase|nr:rhodanese-like domain-containing protein [Saprospiraceae bacterium]MBK8296394.1 rhodanese-like domain-containing protein [Saprospiraceae bacterium]